MLMKRLLLRWLQRQKEKVRKMNERNNYLQLYEAMEALVHIYKEGCRTIGPLDKRFKEDQETCKYAACKGLESLIRHFAACKMRVPGGCIRCKRMWQVFELHSRLCADSDNCNVPLCRYANSLSILLPKHYFGFDILGKFTNCSM